MSTDIKLLKRRVLVACPAKGGIPPRWFEFYASVLALNHPDYIFDFVIKEGHGCINLARNIIAQYAIEGDYWKLVQIDQDQFVTAPQLVRLVSHNEPVVALPYCKKYPGPVKWLVVRTPGAEPREDELLQCDFLPTGALSTEVAVLKAMVDFYPERRFVFDAEDGKQAEMTELFPVGLVGPNTPEGRLRRIQELMDTNGGVSSVTEERWIEIMASKWKAIQAIVRIDHPEKARLLGEDYHFSHLARKAGFKLWCDVSGAVGHIGDTVFPITSDKLSSPAPIPSHALNLDKW